MTALALPNLDDPLDVLMATALLVFGVMSLVNNKLPIVPLLTRSGGLFAYGKFAIGVEFGVSVPSRMGMTLLYFPSMCLGIAFHFHSQGSLACLLSIIHFAKRVAECLFLHNYSGTMPLATSLFTSFGYLSLTFCLCYYSADRILAPDNTYSTKTAAFSIVLFVIGISGNFYHHCILATLRTNDDKTYKVPQGGLFQYVTAPHYLFEVIGWFGMTYAAQHAMATFIAVDMLIYLADRAEGQTKWYLSHSHLKDKYPRNRKHLIPLIL